MTFYGLFISFLKLVRILLAIFIVIFYMPQTYRFNPVTRNLYAWNQFLTYTEAKEFVRSVTPISMLLFGILCLFIGFIS